MKLFQTLQERVRENPDTLKSLFCSSTIIIESSEPLNISFMTGHIGTETPSLLYPPSLRYLEALQREARMAQRSIDESTGFAGCAPAWIGTERVLHPSRHITFAVNIPLELREF